MKLGISNLPGSKLQIAVAAIATAAETLDQETYLVGGVVRDLLLKRAIDDVDIAVSSDAIAIATKLDLHPPPDNIIKYKRYKNVTLEWSSAEKIGVERIDLSTFRAEEYPTPGGRPEIRPGTLEEDLLRRDFTINALAVWLGEGSSQEVIDLCDGLKHLEAKQIEVLHDRSFIEDPVRLIRAVRLEVRLGFSLGPFSIPLFNDAIKENAIATVPENRLQDEIRKAEGERDAAEIVRRLRQRNLIYSDCQKSLREK
jgi:tRNA nucleotidyltransferase (CCA-adding enzyme)